MARPKLRPQRPEHTPLGDPCRTCRLPASRHRVPRPSPARKFAEHQTVGDPCDRCGRRAVHHRAVRSPRLKRKKYDGEGEGPRIPVFYGLDGEGQGHAFVSFSKEEPARCLHDRGERPCKLLPDLHTKHKYTYLACVDEYGEKVMAIENREHGLSTMECLKFLSGLPRHVFGFSLGYDYTKIFQDMPDGTDEEWGLYHLCHEDLRKSISPKSGKEIIQPVFWNGYKLNYVNKRLTIQAMRWCDRRKKSIPVGQSVTIWDIFRFFQQKFVGALADWKICLKEDLERMSAMKDERANFDHLDWEDVKKYCQTECRDMARLVRSLVDAHNQAGLKLMSFFGAGSTATAVLRKFETKTFMADPPDEMLDALSRSFFGGRFEISRAGPIPGPVHGYDISSAYPFETVFLPCLTHGTWEHVRGRTLPRRIREARLALIHATSFVSDRAWGPFPWRSGQGIDRGSIYFPLANPGTWIWKQEYLAAEEHWDVRSSEAWVYDTQCSCQPFAGVPPFYRERVRIGKEGKGIVIKLGCNSIYGKLAQSKGMAPFNCWIWAGNITSGTRGKLLHPIAMGDSDCLMVATDGAFLTRQIDMLAPRDTGTFDVANDKGELKPLGGWEHGVAERGIFLVRPGIYFPNSPTDADLKKVRSRGISKAMLLQDAVRIRESWETHQWREAVAIPGRRFAGMRSSIYEGAGGRITRMESYGEWVQWPIDVSFKPDPKRLEISDRGDGTATLTPHVLPPTLTPSNPQLESAPYDAAVKSPDGAALAAHQEMVEEQPGGGDGLEGWDELID